MNPENGFRIIVPKELRELILEFVLRYLVEQPSNLLDFACDYFEELRTLEKRELQEDYGSDVDSPSFFNREDFGHQRRQPVCSEPFEPYLEDDDEPKIYYPKTDAQREILINAVKDNFLFKSLDQSQLSDLIDAMFRVKVCEGQRIINECDDGDNMYVIEKGIFEAVTGEGSEMKILRTYTNSGFFGELALMYNQPRLATVIARTNGTLWAIERPVFKRIVLNSAFRKRKTYEDFISKVAILQNLEPYERTNLADALVPYNYSDNELIMKEGDIATGMYFVETGEVRVTMSHVDGSEREVDRIMPGGYFGEVALITHYKRTANVYAVGAVRVAFLDSNAFERIMVPCIELMKRNIVIKESKIISVFGSMKNLKET